MGNHRSVWVVWSRIAPRLRTWQNSVKFQLKVRWYGRTMVAYGGIHAGAKSVNVSDIVKMQMEDFERGPLPQM